MRAAGHFYKVIDDQTILVAQDNQQNRRTYEDLVIQTFYLSNAEAKEAVQLVRSLVNTRNLSSSDTLNSITVRDTADKVRIIQRIIETIDKSRAEVVIDIRLIEVDRRACASSASRSPTTRSPRRSTWARTRRSASPTSRT
jgi:general secretion pathway protein D